MTHDERGPADDDAPLDPKAMLALIDGETSSVRRALDVQTPIYYFLWGAAWLVGYLFYWAGSPGSGSPITVPFAVGVSIFAFLVLAAAAASAFVGIRTNRGLKGNSDWVGTIYGLSWPILSVAIVSLGLALIRAGMSTELATIFFTSSFAILVAALYLAGAMIWRSVDQLVIAIIMALAAAITPLFGYPGNLLAMALIAGPALLLGGIVATIRYRKL